MFLEPVWGQSGYCYDHVGVEGGSEVQEAMRGLFPVQLWGSSALIGPVLTLVHCGAWHRGFPSDPRSCTHTWRLSKCSAGQMKEDGKLNASFYTVFLQVVPSCYESQVFCESEAAGITKCLEIVFAWPLAGIFSERWDFINIIPRHTVTDLSGIVVLFMSPNAG